MAKIELILDPKTGDRKYAVEGMEGTSCEDVLKSIEQANEVTDKQYTEEYHVPDVLPDFIHEGE